MKIRSWILVLLFASAGILGTVSGLYYIDNIKPNFDDDYVFYVRPETKMREVMDSLVHGAGALHPKSIERAFRKEEVDGAMKPGKYVVNSSSTSAYVARMGYDIEIARAIVLFVGITLFWVANICYDNTIDELKNFIEMY